MLNKRGSKTEPCGTHREVFAQEILLILFCPVVQDVPSILLGARCRPVGARGLWGPLVPRGVLYIFWVRGRAIGKGIDFHDFVIRNGVNFHYFRKYRVGYAFS